MALSTYLPPVSTLESELSAVNAGVPVFQGHGLDDPMIPVELGKQARDRLRELGHFVTWKTYPMQHEVHPEEISDVGAWLRERL